MEHVTIIVPTYKDNQALVRCVESLLNQSYPSNCYDIIIVNNDPTQEISLQNKKIVIIDEGSPGSYAARNAGIKHASGEIIAFTDADCIADENWLTNAVIKLKSENLNRVAGHVEVYYKSNTPNLIEIYEKITAFNQERNAKYGVSVTANLVVYTRLFDEIGKFNSRLMSGGDIEWNRRACLKGKSIAYERKSVVRHPARSSLSELKKKARRVAAGRIAMESKKRVAKLFRMMLPPISAINDIIKCKEVGFWKKMPLIALAIYLKFYSFLHALGFYLKVNTPQRS